MALHRYRAYPAGHPMRIEARDAGLRLLTAALIERPLIRIAVARRNLLIADESTDPGQPVLRELAERLHRRQIGAIVIRKGLLAEELDAALQRLNADQHAGAAARRPAEPEVIGSHFELFPMSYVNLALAGDEPGSVGSISTDELWAELARLTAVPVAPLGEGNASAVGQVLASLGLDPAVRAEVVRALERFGRAAVGEAGARGVTSRRTLRELLDRIPPEILATLLEIKPDRPEGIERLASASEWLALPALLDLVESASASSGQTVSHFLLRLIRKLATRAPQVEADVGHDHSVRESIQALLRGWNLRDPNPVGHTRLLEELSRHDQSLGDSGDAAPAEGARMVRMAVEVSENGPLVLAAVDRMLDAGELTVLLDILEEVPETNAGAQAIWDHLVESATVREVLLEEPVDHAAAARLLKRVSLASAEGLLDSLTISESRETRSLILRRLTDLGPAVAPLLVDRLGLAPWYVRRNLLGLLADLPEIPAGFSARRYADEAEPLLRHEAIRVMLRSPEDREDAIHRALADPDDRITRQGLAAAAVHGVQRASLPRLMKLLNDGARPVELRARGIGLLMQFATPSVRQWLVERSLVRRGFFKRTRLAPKSPDLLAVLSVLARTFHSHPQTAVVLRLVAESGDPELIGAVEGQPAS